MQSFYHRWTRQAAILLLLITVATTNSSKLTKRSDAYICGKESFSDEYVRRSVTAGLMASYELVKYSFMYDGPLYKKEDGYMMYPIMRDKHVFNIKTEFKKDGYFVIFDWVGKLVDVISRSQYGDVKCLPGNVPTSPSSSSSHSSSTITTNHGSYQLPVTYNGVECGKEFIDNSLIKIAVGLAIHQKDRAFNDSPTNYDGPLCGNNLRCTLWPIYKKSNKIGLNNLGGRSYFVMLDQNNLLRNVVAISRDNQLFVCKAPVKPLSGQPPPKVGPKPSVEPGYKCGNSFFRESYLIDEAIKSREPRPSRSPKRKYPMQYTGSPFNTNVILWPVFPFGKLYPIVRAGKWFLVMTMAHEIICVAVQDQNGFKCCDKGFA